MPTRLLYFVICVILAVILHELGHFCLGKLFKVRIKRLVIFLDLGFHLFSTHDHWFVKIFPYMQEKTELRIGWIPLLAYVQFDTNEEDKVSKCFLDNISAMKRFLITSAGPFVNYMLYVIAFIVLAIHYNPQYKLSDISLWAFKTANCRAVETAVTCIDNVKKYAFNLVTKEDEQVYIVKKGNCEKQWKGDWHYMIMQFPDEWNPDMILHRFMELNLILALCNILPLLPLDGGKMALNLYEMVTRRKPDEDLMLVTTIAGTFIIFFIGIWGIMQDLILDFQ